MQENLWAIAVHRGPGKEIRTDHFQAVARDLSDRSIKAAVSMACSMTGTWLL